MGHGATPHRPHKKLMLILDPEVAPVVSPKTGPESGRKRPLWQNPHYPPLSLMKIRL